MKYMTKEWYQEMQKMSNKILDRTIQTEIINPMKEYGKEYDIIKDKLPKPIVEKLCLHDCLIVEILRSKEKIVIRLDCSEGTGDIKTITFKNYEILEEDLNFTNAWWLYDEIYIVNNQYELHILLDAQFKNNLKLGYFTIRAQDIILT